jgi:hypothetical protein
MSNDRLNIQRAGQARMELRETEAAFDAARLDILNEIAQTKDDESLKREMLFLEVRALDKVRARLQSTISNGAVSAHIVQLTEAGFVS